jgi:CBS domain-containing protein
MKVRSVMTASVASVRKDESLSTAAKLMWDCDCGSIPVKDEAGEQVVGMITDRDICMATWSRDCAPSVIAVSDAMSPELYFSAPDESVASAERLMRARKIRRVPVLDGDRRLVGILSLADIANESRRAGLRPDGSEVAPAEIAGTLADICEPRLTRQPLAPTA